MQARSEQVPWDASHLDWLINSACDYACRGCIPVPANRHDLNLDARLAALRSFADFAANRSLAAQVTLYPRQAPFGRLTTSVLEAIADYKRRGMIHLVTSVTRGDLPADKIHQLREAGVDVCRLTIDGPESLQDELRRKGSHRDTLAAFRLARDAGIRVMPQIIVVACNAPYVVETMRHMLDEGFDGLALQVAIQGDAGGEMRASYHPDPNSPFNRPLTAGQYRSLLLEVVSFLTNAGEAGRLPLARFVRDNQMTARLLYELGRLEEYKELTAGKQYRPPLKFVLRHDGSVMPEGALAEIGAFPGADFGSIFEKQHPMRWFEGPADVRAYMAARQRTFVKCASCAVAQDCLPVLVGWQDRRLFYQPDVHCWVEDGAASNRSTVA